MSQKRSANSVKHCIFITVKQDDGIENFCGNNSKKVTGTQQDPCFLIKKTQRNIATNIAHEHAAAYRSWK